MNGFDDILEAQPGPDTQGGRPFDREAWAEKKQAERKAAYGLADAVAMEVAGDGGKLQNYLEVQARFDRYSVTNALLILSQRPTASQLKDFDGWKEAGADIRRGEKGISILEPGNEYEREDGSIGTSYHVKKVFDISQTTAVRKAAPFSGLEERLLLKALIHRPPVPIRMEDALPGNRGAAYDHEKQTLFVRRGMAAPDIFRSVSMALAQAQIALSRGEYAPESADFPAYCVSYMLCRKYGIDASGYQFPTLPQGFAKADAQGVCSALAEIRDTASHILSRMGRVLEQTMQPKSREQER